jgi:hypothetical protein
MRILLLVALMNRINFDLNGRKATLMYNFIYFWTICIGNGRFDLNIERAAYEACRATRDLYAKSEFTPGPRKMAFKTKITQWSESCRIHNHTLLSHLRLLQPEGPDPSIYMPPEQGGQVIPTGTGFHSCRLLRLEGLR